MTCACGKLIDNEKVQKAWKENWEEVFDMFYNHEEGLGSSAWFCSPDVVKRFIKSIIE